MTIVARHVRFTAAAGREAALADALLEAAEGLRGTPGCLRWVVARAADDPAVVVVDEAWRSAEHLADAERGLEGEGVAKVLALLDPERPPQRLDLEPLGGGGHLPAAPGGVTHRNLLDVEDQAAKHGFGETGEARFATGDLDLAQTGVSLHRLRPGARQAFGHAHGEAEEVYVVLAGSGRARTDGEELPLRPRDAVRVGPETVRAFEADDEGLELLAVGPRRPGDGRIVPGWWG